MTGTQLAFVKTGRDVLEGAGGASGLKEEKAAEEVQRWKPGLYAAGLPFFPSIPASACIPMVGSLQDGPPSPLPPGMYALV